jgi:hypothetical protein
LRQSGYWGDGQKRLSLARYEKAIDSASLQRVAELKAFRLIREGADLETVKRAEATKVGLLDVGLLACQSRVLLRHFGIEGLRLVLRAAGGEL